MRWCCFPAVIAVLLAGCGSAEKKSEAEKKVEAPAPPPPVKDDTGLLPSLNRKAARVVQNHLLDKQVLPGGTIGDYEAGHSRYQMFIIESGSNQDAAILLLDLKNALKDPVYIANMGGYFGADGDKPVYVFAKAKYLAGVTGLARERADPLARQLAARLQ
jgi:hypothetical protein